MAVHLFAAIDVGSYEIAIKIFEISQRGIKEIDHVRHRIELGTDTYKTGKISYDRMDELCGVLSKFKTVMETYKVEAYQAFATSAIRETENTRIVLDQIRLRTGIEVRAISNSEQRFLSYKSVALNAEKFDSIIQDGTAFLDIGGGSVQVSLFQNSKLIASQNLNIGVLKMREQLAALAPRTIHYESLVEELINNELHFFRKMQLKDVEIKNIIVVDDYISYILKKLSGSSKVDTVTGEQFVEFVDSIKLKSPDQFAKEIGLPQENSGLLLPSALIIKHFIDSTGANLLWMPGVSLSDGIAYDYAEKNKLFKVSHDFEGDIISSAYAISKRYRGSKSRGRTLLQVCMAIFDSMKKTHGLDSRARLLMQLAAIMRDCGKFISAQAAGESSYHLITKTEIIGISDTEREIVALTVKNSYMKFLYFEGMSSEYDLDRESYLIMAKLSAIMQVATGLARSKKKPYEGVKAVVKDNELVITIDTMHDITLEAGLFSERTAFFEEVFGLKPRIRRKING